MAQRRDELKVLCENMAIDAGYPASSLPEGLELLGLDLAMHEDPFADELLDQESPPDISLHHTGGPNDGGIDGLLYDSELSCLAFVQSKHKKGKVDADTLEELRSFFNRLDEWVDSKNWAGFNEKVQWNLQRSSIDPTKQEIRLYFVTSQTSSPEAEGEAQAIADAASTKYLEKNWNVSCHFFSQAPFLRAYRDLKEKQKSTLVSRTHFKISPNHQFIFNERSEHRVLLCAIKGNEIHDLYMRTGVGEALFNANIRSALTTGKVNPEIQNTAANPQEAPNFFIFNNGISATCTDFDLSGDQVTATNLQVVNGAQTVNALRKALHSEPNPDVYVLLRLIETQQRYGHKSELADKITRFQNTQNPVKASDFYSNDLIQLWIRDNVPKLSGRGAVPLFWYENKRGPRPTSAKGRKVTIEQLAQLRYACLVDAPFTYRSAKDIWDTQNNSAAYWRAFGSNGEGPVSEWSQEEVAEALWMLRCWFSLRELQKDMQKGKVPVVENEMPYLGVLAKYITALTFVGMTEAQRAGSFESFQDLIGSKGYCDSIQDPILSEARRLVRAEYRSWRQQGVANPSLNMPRSEPTWHRLRRDLVEELKASQVLK